MCGQGGLRTWEQDRARYRHCCSARFRCSHQRRMHTSVQHPPSGTRKPRGHRQSHPHGHPTHLTRPPTPKTTPPETTTPHTRTRPRCPDTPQPQHKTGPISTRRATDLGTGYDRSRAGEQPISTRNRTDLGGVRLAGLTSPGGPRRDDVAPCLQRGRGRRVGASQPALPGRESAARQGRTAYGMMSA